MDYLDNEKKIAKNFINSKIPEIIKWNKCNLDIDTMECYEALFDYADCILNNLELQTNYCKSLENDKFFNFINELKSLSNDDFYVNAFNLFYIIKRYKAL